MFGCLDNKGFHVKFENGWTVSVQFGPGNYCENKNSDCKLPRAIDLWTSPDAEIAAWDAQGNWHHFESDDVEGQQTPAQVLAFMNKISSL